MVRGEAFDLPGTPVLTRRYTDSLLEAMFARDMARIGKVKQEDGVYRHPSTTGGGSK